MTVGAGAEINSRQVHIANMHKQRGAALLNQKSTIADGAAPLSAAMAI